MAEAELVELIVLFADGHRRLDQLLPDGPKKAEAQSVLRDAKILAMDALKG